MAAAWVAGGILFGFIGHFTVKRGRHPIVILGFVLSMIAYALMFINLPPRATIKETDAEAYIGTPLVWLALLTSFVLGFADTCFMTDTAVCRDQTNYLASISLGTILLEWERRGCSVRNGIKVNRWWL